MKRYMVILVLLFLFSSCAWWVRVNMESIRITRADQREAIKNVNLKIDGIYISKYKNRAADFILFENGVIFGEKNRLCDSFYLRNTKYKTCDSFITYVIDRYNVYGILRSEKSPAGWGVYNIEGDKFSFEQWNGGNTYFVTHFEGRIIDSVTIVVPNYFSEADSVFKFYPLENKPDSLMKWFGKEYR